MIEGCLEALGEDGVFVGWVRDFDAYEPAIVQIRHGRHGIAQAAARAFRPDVLLAGHGHGHFGFAARSHAALPPGAAEFILAVAGRDFEETVRLTVPRLAVPTQAAVHTMVGGESSWTVTDLAGAPGCLDLAAEHAAMGTPRFVDVTFRFALQRWPSRAEARVYCAALEEERLAPDALLVELLHSRERADLGESLASPWDPAFPYGQAMRNAPPGGKAKGRGRA